MAGEFTIEDFKIAGDSALLLKGKVESGEFSEGDVGKTFRGKKLALIKIEKNGTRKPRANKGEKLSLFVKYIVPSDIAVGQPLYF